MADQYARLQQEQRNNPYSQAEQQGYPVLRDESAPASVSEVPRGVQVASPSIHYGEPVVSPAANYPGSNTIPVYARQVNEHGQQYVILQPVVQPRRQQNSAGKCCCVFLLCVAVSIVIRLIIYTAIDNS